jgi:hypothetical protein
MFIDPKVKAMWATSMASNANLIHLAQNGVAITINRQ